MNIRRLFCGMVLRDTAAGLGLFGKSPRDKPALSRARLFDIMLPAGVLLGGIAGIISICRCLLFNWYYLAALHACTYLVAAGVVIFRRRLPAAFPLRAVVVLAAVDVVQSLLTTGLAGAAMPGLVCLCIFAGVFGGETGGAGGHHHGSFAVSLMGVLVCTGYRPVGTNSAEYLVHPVTWAVQISCFLLFIFPMVLAVNGIQERILGFLNNL